MHIILNKPFFQKILSPFLGISVFFLLLLGPLLYFSFSSQFYNSYLSQGNYVESKQSLNYAQNVYTFIQGKSSLNPIFTVNEKSHLEDVRQVFYVLSILELIFSIVFLLILFFLVLQEQFLSIFKSFFSASLLIFLTLSSLLIALFLDFQSVFDIFHKVIFPQGNWSFDASSVMVSLFPLSFFEAISLRIFLTSIGISFVFLIFSFFGKRYWVKKN